MIYGRVYVSYQMRTLDKHCRRFLIHTGYDVEIVMFPLCDEFDFDQNHCRKESLPQSLAFGAMAGVLPCVPEFVHRSCGQTIRLSGFPV